MLEWDSTSSYDTVRTCRCLGSVVAMASTHLGMPALCRVQGGMTGQSVGKAARCTDTGTGAYLCLVTEETEEPAVTTSSTWRVAEELGGAI